MKKNMETSSDMPTDPCEDNDPGRRLFGMPPNGDEPPPSSAPDGSCHCTPPPTTTTAAPADAYSDYF